MDAWFGGGEGGFEVGDSCSGLVEFEGEAVYFVAEVVYLLLEPYNHLLKRRNLRLRRRQRSLQTRTIRSTGIQLRSKILHSRI